MNKRQKTSLILILLMLAFTRAAFAQNPTIKLSRGLANIVTSPAEYLLQYKVIRSEYNFVQTFFATMISGTLHTLGRAAVGAYDVVTFLIPLPPNYEPLYKPETIFEALEQVDGGKSVI